MLFNDMTEDQKDLYLQKQYEQLGSDDIYSWVYDILYKDNTEQNCDIDITNLEIE